MRYKEEFQRVLDYHLVEHFSAEEVLYLGGANSDESSEAYKKNSLPPVYLWCNIIETVLLVDDIRKHFGSATVINNGYRNEEYNGLIGGSTNSQHKEFTALDFYVKGHLPMVVAQKLKEWRLEGRFQGGIGTYNTFVHLDTRGNNATWEG